MDNIQQRIKYLVKELRMTQQEFAEKIGVDPTNFSKYLNGRMPINDSLINKIVVEMGVAKRWLTHGEDIPFPGSAEARLPEVVEVGQGVTETQGGAVVYDVDVTAGAVARSRIFTQENVLGSINMPGVLDPRCRVVRVSGDSMQPTIKNGDWIALRSLSNFDLIYWGQIYVVVTDEYRMLKYVRKHKNPAMVILHSENPNYDDIELPRSEIRELMLVQNILHIDCRM